MKISRLFLVPVLVVVMIFAVMTTAFFLNKSDYKVDNQAMCGALASDFSDNNSAVFEQVFIVPGMVVDPEILRRQCDAQNQRDIDKCSDMYPEGSRDRALCYSRANDKYADCLREVRGEEIYA